MVLDVDGRGEWSRDLKHNFMRGIMCYIKWYNFALTHLPFGARMMAALRHDEELIFFPSPSSREWNNLRNDNLFTSLRSATFFLFMKK